MSDEQSLFQKAQKATADAVKHAKGSDDAETTKGLRDKASDLFEQYVHKRVHLASLERKTTVAKDGITKMSDVVKQKKEQAKVAMAAKKKALDSIAAEKIKVAELKSNIAKEEVKTSKQEVQASSVEKKMLHSKVESIKKTAQKVTDALEASLTKSKKIEHLASTATKMVKETEDMSLKALMAQSEDMGLDDPIERDAN